MSEDLGSTSRPLSLTGEQWRMETRTDDPASPEPDERWIRSDLDSGDRVATLKCGDGTEIPLFATGTAEETVREARRFRVGGQTVYAPIAPVSEAAFPARRVQHDGQVHAFHDRVGPSSAISDSLVDNFEAESNNGPYATGDGLSTYYDLNGGGFQRTLTSPLLGDYSVERTSADAQDNDSIVSAPGDGLPNYPNEGESLSAYVNTADAGVVPTVLAGVPETKGVNGYGLLLVGTDDVRLSKFNDGSRTDLDTITPSLGSSDDIELVVSPPLSGGSSVDAAVWQVDTNFNRISQVNTLTASDTDFTGERGVGLMAQSFRETGRVGDQLTRGRGIN